MLDTASDFRELLLFCPKSEPFAAMQPKNNADGLGNVADIRGHDAARARQHGAAEIIDGAVRAMDEGPRLGNGSAVFCDEHRIRPPFRWLLLSYVGWAKMIFGTRHPW